MTTLSRKPLFKSPRLWSAIITHDYSTGFTIPEVIASSLIVLVVLVTAAQSIVSSIRIFSNAAARDALEAVVAEDLRWIRAYSKSWHCEVGPYATCNEKTLGLSSALNYMPDIYSEEKSSDYSLFKTLCLNRETGTGVKPSDQILIDASKLSVNSDGSLKPRDPIPESSDEVTLLSLTSAPIPIRSYKLYRQITSDATGNSLTVRYYLDDKSNPSLAFSKLEKLFIEATAWCP